MLLLTGFDLIFCICILIQKFALCGLLCSVAIVYDCLRAETCHTFNIMQTIRASSCTQYVCWCNSVYSTLSCSLFPHSADVCCGRSLPVTLNSRIVCMNCMAQLTCVAQFCYVLRGPHIARCKGKQRATDCTGCINGGSRVQQAVSPV
jgi:hypothetical protein